MSKKNDGGYAFPMEATENTAWRDCNQGMTLRDYMAAKAMQALVTSGLNTGAWEDYDDLAKSAWSIADAMLRAGEAS